MKLLELSEITRIDLEKTSTVYGPVRSWRVGWSLGVDLLCLNSICSFNCSYCQLGYIQVRINERKTFVPTSKVMSDLGESNWKQSDIVTFSGSGEPTLAANLGEVIAETRAFTKKPTLVLSNGTLLSDHAVRQELSLSDRVYLKLDAASNETLRRVNRPVPGIDVETLVEGAVQFRDEYSGFLGIQMMFVHSNTHEIEELSLILKRIQPDEVQVNTPTRPYPSGWYLASRGSHEGVDYPAKPLKTVPFSELERIVSRLRDLTRLNIISVARAKKS